MKRYLKVEIYPHLFNRRIKEPRTFLYPFEEDSVCVETSKGWLYVAIRNEKHVISAFLEEPPSCFEEAYNHDSYRIAPNMVTAEYRKMTRIFEDEMDIYLSLYYE